MGSTIEFSTPGAGRKAVIVRGSEDLGAPATDDCRLLTPKTSCYTLMSELK